MPFPSPGDLPNLEVKPRSLASSALAGGQYSVGKNNRYHAICIILFYSLLKYLINMVIILNLYFILGGSKITADGEFTHEIKRHLLLKSYDQPKISK